jgi:hypothetical protein
MELLVVNRPKTNDYEKSIVQQYSTPGLVKNKRVLTLTEEAEAERERQLLADMYGAPPRKENDAERLWQDYHSLGGTND